MTLTRSAPRGDLAPDEERTAPELPHTEVEQTPEQAVLDEYKASLHGPGRPLSQRFLAEKYGIDRRKVKQIITNVEPLDQASNRGTPATSHLRLRLGSMSHLPR